MPSQRLLKIIEPHGHVDARRAVLDTAHAKAIVWGSVATQPWVARALWAANIQPLLAVSFRHVAVSLRDNTRPRFGLAVLDFDVLGEEHISELASARWVYTGQIIAISRTTIASRVWTMLSIDSIANDEATLTKVLGARV